MIPIIKKELKTYFLTPIGYIFIGLFLLLSSMFFYLNAFSTGTLRLQDMFTPVATILTFMIPILTMRAFAEERKNGTSSLLFTSPVSVTSIVLGKFLASVIMIVIASMSTIFYYLILKFFGTPDFTVLITTIIGFILLGMAYISFGIFASSLTENQIIAAIITIAFFVITWFLPSFNSILTPFSLITLFDKFLAGVISFSDIFAFISFTFTFLLLTIIRLQRRRSV